MRERDGEAAAIAEWSELLDRFERDLDAAEPSREPWRPAASPLPAPLVERARGIARRQQRRLERLEQERAETAGQRAALRRVPVAPRRAPAYLDLDG